MPERDFAGEIVDAPAHWRTTASAERFRGRIISVRSDRVLMPGSGGAVEEVEREIVTHPGSVSVLALDDAERVLMLRQYRHPVGRLLWEIPAGLRDVAGEPLRATAARELAEEAGYAAGRWDALVDVFISPGMGDERSRVFLARDLTPLADGELDFERVHEEADMPLAWVPLDEAVHLVLAARVHNQQTALGVLAAHAARADGFASLRPADAAEE